MKNSIFNAVCKTRYLALLVVLIFTCGNAWGTDVTLASWSFSSGTAGTNYPDKNTEFAASSGTCSSGSTFNIAIASVTYNTTKNSFAFTTTNGNKTCPVITIKLKLASAIPSGTELTLTAYASYNNNTNKPCGSYNITVSTDNSTYSTTGLGTTSWTLSNGNPAEKSTVYTTQANLAANSYIYFKFTGQTRSGNGQGYFNNPIITMPAASCTDNPSVGAASLNGSFASGGVTSLSNLSEVFAAASSGAGSNCSLSENGFVWSSSASTSSTLKKGETGVTYIAGGTPDGSNDGAFTGTLSGTWTENTTYYYRSYVKNNGDNVAYNPANDVNSFTPRKITFNSNGGSSVDAKYIESGGVMTAPTAPTKADNVFAGWYSNEGLTSPVNWGAAVTASATYYAKWYTIDVLVKDEAGNTLSGSGKPTANCTGTTLSTAAGSEKYVFKEWQVSNTAELGSSKETASNSLTNITGNVTVTAVYHAPITLTKGTNTGASTFNFSSNPIGYGETLTITCAADASHKGNPTVTADGTHGTISVVSATSVTIANVQSAMTVNISYTAKETATVKLHVAGSTSTISGTRYEGDSYTLPSEAAECPEMGLYGWYTTDYEHATTAPSGANFKLPGASATLAAGDNDFYAVYATVTPDAADTYTMITTTGELVTGDYLLVAYYSSTYIEAMKNTVNESNYMDEVNVKNYVNNTTTPTKVTLESDNSAIRWRITKSSSTITIYNAAVSKYFCGSTGTPALNTTSEDFSYSVTSGDWALVTNSKTVYYSNQWYVGTPSSSSAKPIYLFKRDPLVAGPYTTTPSCTTHSLSTAVTPVSTGTAVAGKTVIGEGKTTTVTATPNEHYTFSYWTISGTGSTMSNTSDGKSTDNPVTVTMGAEDATITAHFTEKPKCTVVFKNNGTQLSSTTYWQGENPVAPTLTDGTNHDACDETSDTHYGWTQTTMPDVVPSKATIDAYTGAQTVYAKAATLPAITAGDDGTTITYHAVWAESVGVPSNEYQLVTNISQLSAGDKIVIANAGSSSTYLMGKDTVTEAGYQFRKVAQVGSFSISSSKITISTLASSATDRNNPHVFTVGKSGDYWTFYDPLNSAYISCASVGNSGSGTKNGLGYESPLSDAGKWSISISDNVATILSQIGSSTTTRNRLQANGNPFSTASSFTCTKNTMTDPYIFRNLSTLGYQKFLTTCCDKKVTLSEPVITDAASSGSTVTYTESSAVATCDGAKEVHVTITPAAGYQATSISFGGTATQTSVSPAISTPLTTAQTYTISYAKDINGTLVPTVTFEKKTATAWTWTYNSGAIPDPLVLYVGINKQLDVTYEPADLLNNQKNYSVTKESSVAEGGKGYAYYKMRGAAGVSAETNSTVTFTLNGLSQTVNVTVKPQPKVYFVDIVHNETFDPVMPAVETFVANFVQQTPTHADVAEPGTGNSCEKQHLHLIGWIRSDYSKVEDYLNGTGAKPSITDLTDAGTDGEGLNYYFEPNADINVEDYNGLTFYAVWAKEVTTP